MKRCLLVAPLVSHATAGRIAALGASGFELHLADVSTRPVRHRLDRHPFTLVHRYHDLHVAEADPLFRPGCGYAERIRDTLRSRRLLPEAAAIAANVRAVMNEAKPDVVVVYYAALAIHYARIVRRLFPDVPVVIIHNAFPSTLARKGALRRCVRNPLTNEFVDYAQWLRKLDFYVHASEGMVDFAERRFGVPRGRTAVLPDYLPRSMHARELAAELSGDARRPRVIFLGAPERWGATIDNPDAQFVEITRHGVEVHAGEMGEAVLRTGYGFKYRYFSDDEVFEGELAQYAHGFDAALMSYGIDQRRERFRTTLPTRFLTALTAGIPIAVRAGLFDAAESYVREHDIGFAYTDARDLAARLADRERMAAYRRAAIGHLGSIGGETQAGEFDKILGGLSR